MGYEVGRQSRSMLSAAPTAVQSCGGGRKAVAFPAAPCG